MEVVGIVVMVVALGLVVGGGLFLLQRMTETKQNARLERAGGSLAVAVNSKWYPHAVAMARLLEALRSDPMVACTIEESLGERINKELDEFWQETERH